MIRKGEKIHMHCCGRDTIAQFDFEPRNRSLYDAQTDIHHNSGPCFRCVLPKIKAALAEHGIRMLEPDEN